MRNLFKKSWFVGTIILGLMLIMFLINLWVMSLKITFPYTDETFWTLASNISSGRYINIFAFSFKLAFYISIIPLLLAGFSILKKKSWGLVVTVLFFLGFETSLIVFQSLNHYLTVFAIVLTIINVVFTVSLVVLIILRSKLLAETLDIKKEESDIQQKSSKTSILVLLIDFAAIVGFLLTFIIPLYSRVESGSTYNAILINVLLSSDTHLYNIVSFFVDFGFFLVMLFLFASSLSHYFFDKKRFINQSKKLIIFAFFATSAFFLAGLILNIYFTINGILASTVAFIPLLIMILVTLVYSIIRGQYNAYYQISNKTYVFKYPKIEPLLYLILLTSVSVLMLLLPIVFIRITAGSYNYDVDLTGINILQDYAFLGSGYRIIAYILVVMLLSVGLSLVIAITGYLSKYRHFSAIVKSVTVVNVLFVFIISISGYYFQIAQQINQVVIFDIFEHYGVNIPSGLDYTYIIKTDAIYALIASVLVLILMFFRKGFDRDEMSLADGDPISLSNQSLPTGDSSLNKSEDTLQSFDPCPAFTELDFKAGEFKKDLERRKGFKTNVPSLGELVNFVVEYARNSLLHLSYTPEDIATFVAGLGASRLSILQGMSGTGKTSLPKIFSEAIFGNCEIIEVESSWKDKNELLGYYNEFSTKYTPKKFTLALYKAALNQEISTFILLDEMNLSRIEYYFSDFLSLMENTEDRREIKLVNIKLSRTEKDKEIEYLALTNGHTLKVPSNVWFIGTANRDESTFVISDKVYDRAQTMNFTKRAPKVRNYSNPIPQQYYDYKTINDLFVEAKQKGTFDAENSELIKKVESLLAPFNISFGNRILKQIEDFVNIYNACFVNVDVESEAIEKILLSKVVSKLEVKTIDDKEKLESEFEKLKLLQCVEFIKRLDND